MLFLLDNYDSFTYNLVDYCHRAGSKVVVKRNDETSLKEIEAFQPSGIIMSPGPEVPQSSGILMDVIQHFAGKIPILGICLGHQAIGQYLGMPLIQAPEPVHGKTCLCSHKGHALFKHIPSPYKVMRYHSLLLKESLIKDLEIISRTEEGRLVMAIHHRRLNLTGVQFHPESILTPDGLQLIKNWLANLDVQ